MYCQIIFFVKVLPNYWKELFASNLDIIQVVNFQALTKFWALPKEMDVPNSKYELSFNIINYNALRKKKKTGHLLGLGSILFLVFFLLEVPGGVPIPREWKENISNINGYWFPWKYPTSVKWVERGEIYKIDTNVKFQSLIRKLIRTYYFEHSARIEHHCKYFLLKWINVTFYKLK